MTHGVVIIFQTISCLVIMSFHRIRQVVLTAQERARHVGMCTNISSIPLLYVDIGRIAINSVMHCKWAFTSHRISSHLNWTELNWTEMDWTATLFNSKMTRVMRTLHKICSAEIIYCMERFTAHVRMKHYVVYIASSEIQQSYLHRSNRYCFAIIYIFILNEWLILIWYC